MATIDLGKVALVWKGTFDSATTYESKDVVQYTDSGEVSSYIYVNASGASGQTPSTGGTVNTTYWNKMAGGAAGIWSSGLSLGSAGEAVKVNAAGNALEFGAAGKNIVMKTTQNEQVVTADANIVDVDIVATTANPTFNISGTISLNTRSDANLDNENVQIDVDYSLDGGSSWTTLANVAYGTDVFAPGRDDTHGNQYDVAPKHMGTRQQVTMSAGATVRFRMHLDYGSVANNRTIYLNRAASTSGQGASTITVYEE
tara:strand:- start:2543 stop:3313 length:771 start_codon:yes stop_codon:yes gene_type:complete